MQKKIGTLSYKLDYKYVFIKPKDSAIVSFYIFICFYWGFFCLLLDFFQPLRCHDLGYSRAKGAFSLTWELQKVFVLNDNLRVFVLCKLIK